MIAISGLLIGFYQMKYEMKLKLLPSTLKWYKKFLIFSQFCEVICDEKF